MSILVYVLIFVATVFALESVFLALRARRDTAENTARRRLRRLAAPTDPSGDAQSQSALRPEGASSLDRLLGVLPSSDWLALLLYRAGVATTPQRFLALSAFLGVAGLIFGRVLFEDALAAGAMIGIGALPLVSVVRRGRKRMQAFEEQFPDALALLTRALRAGHSLSFGFQMTGEELPDPVGSEFSQVAEEVKLGQEMSTALGNLVHRVGTPDVAFFATAIGIQRETGGNLTEVLEKLDYIIRERFKLYGKVRALTAIGRMSANLLAFFPVVMVGGLYVVNKDYIAPLWETQEGHMMALISVICVAIGYFMCRQMASIKV